jgi:hypothetical protein
VKNSDLLAGFLFSMDFFLWEPAGLWFWRGTDDVVINFPKPRPVLHELHAQHNPLRERVIYSHCEALGGNKPLLLRGGAGYLISRAAVQGIVLKRALLMARPNVYEDHWFGTVLHTIGERCERMASKHFMGGTVWEQDKIMLLHRNWRRMQSWDAPREAGAR